MHFNLEEIPLRNLKSLHLIRGYPDGELEKWQMGAILVTDKQDQCHIKLWHKNPDDFLKLLTKRDMINFAKFILRMGVTLHAKILRSDFERFWENVKSTEIEIKERKA